MLSSNAARWPPVAATAVSQSGNMIHARPQTADHTVCLAATWVVCVVHTGLPVWAWASVYYRNIEMSIYRQLFLMNKSVR